MTAPLLPDSQKDAVARMTTEGLSDAEIGLALGCSKQIVYLFRAKHGIRKGACRPRRLPERLLSPLPIRTYFDPAVNFEVKVFAPRQASGDIPLHEEGF